MSADSVAPDIELDGTGGRRRLRPSPGKRLVIAFYQEDSTPTCTTQLNAFKEDFSVLQELGAEMVAISADTLDSHRAFLDRMNRPPFPLLSDPQGEAAKAFGAWDSDERRAKRALFVIDDQGRILHACVPYNPSNLAQYEQLFQALGFSDSEA
jgi:thioredoxin-dependent peroxiredoxin